MERKIIINDNIYKVFFDLVPLDEWEPGFNFYKYAIEIEEININGAWIDTCNLYVKRGLSYLSLEEAITVDLYDLLEKENAA